MSHIIIERKYIKTRDKLHTIYNHNDCVNKSLKLFNIDRNNSEIREIIKSLFNYLKLSGIDEKIENELAQSINNVESRMLKVHHWKSLYYITSLNGRFYLANLFREHALKRSLSYQFKLLSNPFLWDLKYRALLDEGSFDQAFDLIHKIELSILRFLYPIKFMKVSVMTFNENRFNLIPYLMKKTKKSNSDYYNLVKGKKIALVGPAPSDDNWFNELNEFDLIIRLNYRGKEFLPGENENSKKIDISYYNGENADNLLKLESKEFLNELKFANFKGNIFKLLDKEYRKKFKLMIYPDISFIGSYNMIPLVLFDLLFYSPKSIKVFKTTFFISRDSYDSNYTLEQNTNRDLSSYYNSFTVHNPISQIRYVRNLYLNGIIEVDDNCAKVLELSDDEYLKILQKEYS